MNIIFPLSVRKTNKTKYNYTQNDNSLALRHYGLTLNSFILFYIIQNNQCVSCRVLDSFLLFDPTCATTLRIVLARMYVFSYSTIHLFGTNHTLLVFLYSGKGSVGRGVSASPQLFNICVKELARETAEGIKVGE